MIASLGIFYSCDFYFDEFTNKVLLKIEEHICEENTSPVPPSLNSFEGMKPVHSSLSLSRQSSVSEWTPSSGSGKTSVTLLAAYRLQMICTTYVAPLASAGFLKFSVVCRSYSNNCYWLTGVVPSNAD